MYVFRQETSPRNGSFYVNQCFTFPPAQMLSNRGPTLRTCQTIFLSRNISFPLILSEHRSSRVQITPNRYIVYKIIWIYLKYIFIHTKVSHENTEYNYVLNFSVTYYSLLLLLHRHCHLLCVESVCCIELKREIKLLLLLVCNLHHL